MHFFKHLKGVKVTMENKGEELVITAKGSKETIANLEKKLGAVKELCGDCCGGEGSCC
ncbi:MAG: hypothetical protein V1922_00630 [bacterium]